MELIADTNIIAAALLRKGLTRNLLFNSQLTLYSPDRLSVELFKHEEEFLTKSGLTYREFTEASSLVLSRVTTLPFETYSAYAKEAQKITPHHKDWPFFAVALQKKCGIWTSEKKLKEQDRVKVYSTTELLKILRA